MFRLDQRQTDLFKIKTRRFFVLIFDFCQHILVFLAIIWLAGLGWLDFFSLKISELLRDQAPIHPRLVLIEASSLDYSVESITEVVANFQKIRVLAIDSPLSEDAKQLLNKQYFPTVTSQTGGLYRPNVIQAEFKTRPTADNSYEFQGIYGEKDSAGCFPSYAYAVYRASQGLGNPCATADNFLYSKPTSYSPFLADLFGLANVSLIPGPNQGTNTFLQTDAIYFTRAQGFATYRLDDLINSSSRFNLDDKIIVIGSGERLQLAAQQINSLLQGAIYRDTTNSTNLVILSIIVILEVLFFAFNNSNYKFYKEKYKAESQITQIFSRLKYQGVHLTFETTAYLLLFALLAVIFLVFHHQVAWLSILLTIIITRSYLMLRSQVSLTRQKTSLEKAFSRYVNPNLLTQIQQNMGEVVLGGERREVTVMFADVRGFTALSEQISSVELVSLLNSYLNRMGRIILNNDGTIDKFMGDGLMALWNAPIADPQHTPKAIKAALEMVSELNQFNQSKLANYKLQIGIGLNSGEVIVGNIGSDSRLEYTAIGSNVNLASRIESLTGKYAAPVLISESVYEKNQDYPGLIFRLVDITVVKGNQRPLRIYEPMLNTPTNREHKYKYEKGFYHYQQLDLATAYDWWHQLPQDLVAIRMIERIMLFGNFLRGSQTRWDGIWRWSDK
jgi:class 3 adenylate cyclase